MEKTFYVLKSSEGDYLPMVFITLADEVGEIRKRNWILGEGETFVKVKLVEVSDQQNENLTKEQHEERGDIVFSYPNGDYGWMKDRVEHKRNAKGEEIA